MEIRTVWQKPYEERFAIEVKHSNLLYQCDRIDFTQKVVVTPTDGETLDGLFDQLTNVLSVARPLVFKVTKDNTENAVVVTKVESISKYAGMMNDPRKCSFDTR